MSLGSICAKKDLIVTYYANQPKDHPQSQHHRTVMEVFAVQRVTGAGVVLPQQVALLLGKYRPPIMCTMQVS